MPLHAQTPAIASIAPAATRPGAADRGVRVRVVPGLDRAAAEAAWTLVAARAGHVPLAASWPWTATWLEHYGDATSPNVLVVDDEDGPCAALLLTRSVVRRGPVPVRRLHVGTAGEPPGSSVCVEHNALLCDPRVRPEALRALAATVAATSGWDDLVVEGAPDDDLARAVADAVAGARLTSEHRPIPIHDLRAAPAEDLATALRSGPRRRVRAGLRAFAARGPLAVDRPEDAAGALEILDELVARHQARWRAAGQPGSFASARFLAFHRALVARLVPAGDATVLRVRCGAETIGCLYVLHDGQRALFYQSGLASFDDNRLRAGLVAHAVAMADFRDRGFAVYDFLAGEHRYKRELATGEETLVWSVVERPRVRLQALRIARAVRALSLYR